MGSFSRAFPYSRLLPCELSMEKWMGAQRYTWRFRKLQVTEPRYLVPEVAAWLGGSADIFFKLHQVSDADE